MNFSTKTDIEAPIAHVFAEVTDFPAFERQAMRRGADVRRRNIAAAARPGPGAIWDVSFKFRGRERQVELTMAGFEDLTGYTVDAMSKNVSGRLIVDLVALSRSRTRLSVSIELSPRTLTARLVVQSMKLRRGNLNRKFATRVGDYAKEVEDRYRQPV